MLISRLTLNITRAHIYGEPISSFDDTGSTVEVDHDATAARWAEFMRHLLFAKEVGTHLIVSGVEGDLVAIWVHKEVAIACADGAITVDNFEVIEGGNKKCEGYGAAMAVSAVASEV